MKKIMLISGWFAIGLTATPIMAIEEPSFTVIKQDGPFELRGYDAYCVAETVIASSDFDEAGNQGFRRLFRYIQGENQAQKKIPMTAPVGMETSAPVKIPMTAPVGQSLGTDGYQVWFVMPKGETIETLPKPTNPQVRLRNIEARHVAVLRYSGGWSESRYHAKKDELLNWIGKQKMSPVGPPVLARFNSPFTLWFLRRNEVQIEVNDKISD